MDDPQVAPAGKPLDFLQSVPSMPVPVTSGLDTPAKGVSMSYQAANSNGVTGAKYTFGQQSDVASQSSMVPQGAQPAFATLQPKPMPTTPGPMGTDYEP